MVWKAKETRIDYPQGTNKLRRKRAWLPTYIDGNIVWLSLYEVLMIYVVTAYSTKINGNDAAFGVGKWIEVSKRLIK